MPIPFSLIPEHIQIPIARQVSDVVDFASFKISSQESNSAAMKVKAGHTLSVDFVTVANGKRNDVELTMPIGRKMEKISSLSYLKNKWGVGRVYADTVEVRGTFTPEICNWLTAFATRTKSSFNLLSLSEVACTAPQLNGLLEAADIKKFKCTGIMQFWLWQIPAMKKIESLTLTSTLKDKELLLLKAAHTISAQPSSISGDGFNRFLKEWINNERQIKKVSLRVVTRVKTEEGLQGIPYTTRPWPGSYSGQVYLIKNVLKARLAVKINGYSIGCCHYTNESQLKQFINGTRKCPLQD